MFGTGCLYLFLVSKASDEEGHAQDKQKVCKNGAENGGLGNSNLILCKTNDKDDQFHGISERYIEKST